MLNNKLFVLGKAGSGKNYVINIIKEIESEFKVVKIAEPLYHLIALIKRDCLVDSVIMLKNLGFSEHTAKNIVVDVIANIDYNSLYLEKPRQPLQIAGDMVRKYDKDILTKYAYCQTINADKIIIEDVRLKSEVNYFASKGFSGIKVCASNKTRYQRLKVRDKSYNKQDLLHKTETEVDKIDNVFYIFNEYNTSKQDIIEQLRSIKIIPNKGLSWIV